MTVEEKLVLFKEQSLNKATEKYKKELEDFNKGLNEELDKFKQELDEKNKEELNKKRQELFYEMNKDLATHSWNEKLRLAEKKEELRKSFFKEVEAEAVSYTKTDEYLNSLRSNIEEVKNIAKNNEFIVYLSVRDKDLLDKLKSDEYDIEISDVDFIGGIRASIPCLNIMIDNSLRSRLDELMNSFDLDKGGL